MAELMVGGWPHRVMLVVPWVFPMAFLGQLQGGEQRDGGLNGLLSSLLASQGNIFFLPAEFFPSSLGM